MKIKTMLKRVLTLMISAAFIISLSAPSVSAVVRKKLRVGYVGYINFMSPNEDGEMYGYGVEYLRLIGRQAGYDFEYVPCSWSESLEMLTNREIDIVCTASYTDERAEIYDYSDHSFIQMQGVIYTKMDNDIYYEDYEAFEGKNVGFIRSAINAQMFAEYAKINGFGYNECLFDNEEEMHAALMDGNVDAIATESSSEHPHLKVVGVYDTGLNYIMSYKNNDFMDDINLAMTEIFASDSNIQNRLYEKYFTPGKHNLSLTRPEAEFVRNCGIINVGMISDKFPLSMYDEASGKFGGVTYEIFERISEISGLEFYYTPITAETNCVEELDRGKFNIAVGSVNTDAIKENDRLIGSVPYIVSTTAAVGRMGNSEIDIDDDHTIIACREGETEYAYMAKIMFGSCTVKYYDTFEECLDAVRDGAADYFVQNIYVVNYLLQKPAYNNLDMLPSNFMQEHNIAIFRSDINPHFVSVINKAIQCISEEEKQEIILDCTFAKPYRLTFTDVLFRYAGTLIIAVMIVAIMLGAFAYTGVMYSKRYAEVKEINRQLREDLDKYQKIDSERRKLFFSISKDIRSPLNTIKGITTAAFKNIEDRKRTEDYLEKIRMLSGQLQETADSITRMCGHEESVENYERFFMLDVLKEISSTYTADLGKKNIDFSVNSLVSCPKLGGNAALFKELIAGIIADLSGCAGRGGCISFNVTDALVQGDSVFVKFVVECDRPQIADPDFENLKKLAEELSGAFIKELTSTRIVVTCDIPFEKVEGTEEDFSETDSAVNALIFDSDPNSSAFILMTLEKVGITASITEDETELLESLHPDKYNVCFIGGTDGTKRIYELAGKLRDGCTGNLSIVAVMDAVIDIPHGCDYTAEKSRLQPQIFRIMFELTEKIKESNDPKNVASKFNFAGKKILVADENEISAEITAELIRMTGAECEVCVNGDTAVKMFEIFPSGNFDAIILALEMPVMDGFTACTKIRSSVNADGKTIPVFALSAYALKSDISAAHAAGMNGHISKPVDNMVLYKTLEKAFNIREKS